MAVLNKGFKVLQGAKILIYVLIVHNIILMIGQRRGNRGEPDFICKEGSAFLSLSVIDVVKLLSYTFKVSYSVSIAVIEG